MMMTMKPKATYGVIDLFAGPGGLAEGFARYRDSSGHYPFRIRLSVEKDKSAHATLQLRAFTRQFPYESPLPPEYLDLLAGQTRIDALSARYPAQWAAAEQEALCLELGQESDDRVLRDRLEALLRAGEDEGLVVIGGPPCQAYSLVGRARNRGIPGYDPAEDGRHYLYRSYLSVLAQVKPVAFVMENVKGILSSRVGGQPIFLQILRDLQCVHGSGSETGYRLHAFASRTESPFLTGTGYRQPDEFIVRAESHGIPQRRHRVIVGGFREDLYQRLHAHERVALRLHDRKSDTVGQVIGWMPALLAKNSGRGGDSRSVAAIKEVVRARLAGSRKDTGSCSASELARIAEEFLDVPGSEPGDTILAATQSRMSDDLETWLLARAEGHLPNHDVRTHMGSDLERYFFCALYSHVHGVSPKADAFPAWLAPNHRNWKSGKFSDRFRVQLMNQEATTITSHISKDGHYFIHPDPSQCRSLSVREAARLQTFPDDYLFLGNRTQQYVQVGNAVPPLLACRIAEKLHEALERSLTRVSRNKNEASSAESAQSSHSPRSAACQSPLHP